MIEKRYTTPQYYPITQNAVRVACNQKNARDPVVSNSDNEVFDLLRRASLSVASLSYGFLDSSRTAKYELRIDQPYELEKPELVLLCELLQTPAPNGGRTAHPRRTMHSFHT
jgi:uncharacterized protein YceH (UPF0502 family)